MTNPQAHHQKYWNQEKTINFLDYERNIPLPSLIEPNSILLDLGCGDGAVGEYLIGHNQATVIGIDFSQTALKRAKKRGLHTINAHADSVLPIRSNSIDICFFGDVIEHIYSPATAIKEIYRVLKPQGSLIISCPNMGYWRYRLHYLTQGMFPETEWIESDLWESEHIRFFNQKLLYQLLKQHNFLPQQFIGISRRRLDQPLLHVLPSLFGMIMLIKATKS